MSCHQSLRLSTNHNHQHHHYILVWLFISCHFIGYFFRLVVVLNGYEAIFDAMVRHSEEFTDRTNLYIEKNVTNHELRGQSHHQSDIKDIA